MNRAVFRRPNLFRRLGLDAGEQAIADFIRTNQPSAEIDIDLACAQ